MVRMFGSILILFSSFFLWSCGASSFPAQEPLGTLTSFNELEFKPYQNARFKGALDTIFERGSDSNTLWSIEILASGPRGDKLSLYSRNLATAVKPASTMKLVTSWTAFQEILSASQMGSEKFNYIREMMKHSDNEMAENVLRWSGGIQALYNMIDQFGISSSAGLNFADGSGLSYANRLSAHDLVQLLSVVARTDKVEAFRALLPIAGVDGTLAGRMSDLPGKIIAKTGTLIQDPTTALAGYGESQTGWKIVFAILGDSVLSVDAGRQSIDSALFEVVNTLNYLPFTENIAEN